MEEKITIDLKKCTKCKNKFPRTREFFYSSKNEKDQLHCWCKGCINTSKKIWKKNNKDLAKKYGKIAYRNRCRPGLCNVCIKNNNLPDNKMCENCWYNDKARLYLKNNKLGFLLKEKAQKQNFKCAYSGDPLIPGLNMSIDHIIAQKVNPKLIHDISNLQWVTKEVNTSKNYLLPEQYVEICKKV